MEEPELSWIWTAEAKTSAELPAGTRWFRKTFVIDRAITNPVDDAVLEITADNAFKVWFNGVEIGQGNNWQRMYRFDVKTHAVHGTNVIAVAATNEGHSPAGLLVRLTTTPNGKTKIGVPTDSSWKTSRTQPPLDWQKVAFDDKAWEPAHAVGTYGTQPWGIINWTDAPSSNRFKLPAGFVVDTIVPPNPVAAALDRKLPFSLINMTFDARGRLLVSQERGPVLLCQFTTDSRTGKVQYTIKPYCTQIKGAQGLCWVKDALLVVGDGPKGTGLYQVKDTNGDDLTDDVKLLHRFKGDMGEHGPHAILHGPDDWLYLVTGNHAWAQPKHLAKNSPLMRWPNGTFGPDQGDPNTTEDVLLPRLNDARGHAANILAPGGTIWRMDHEGKNMSLVAAGFRNAFDAAFTSQGELFTFDSDMEWDIGLPWYRPVRVCHCPPGADFVWRTGAANTPDYYLDSLEPLAETGRGSPVGVAFYEHHQFPPQYQGAFFLGDWSMGQILVVHLKPHGATFKGNVEKFCVGTPLNVTDLEVGPDGCMYFTLGGRGTAGGIYRIRYTGTVQESASQSPPQPLAAWSPGRSSWKDPHNNPPTAEACQTDLQSGDPLKQRHACEAIIRFGYAPPLDLIWPLLNNGDQYLRTAARLVLQRIEPSRWIGRVAESDDLQAMEGIVALCKTNQAATRASAIYERLARLQSPRDTLTELYQLRTWQLAFVHAPIESSKPTVQAALHHWFDQFPARDSKVNRELAILLTHGARSGWTDLSVHEKLLTELSRSSNDRQQQIHYFYCLRLLHQGWSPEQKRKLLTWYEHTRTWTGGHSFTPFLENILKDWLVVLSPDERIALLEHAAEIPYVTLTLLHAGGTGMPAAKLLSLYHLLAKQSEAAARNAREAVLESLGKQINDTTIQTAVRDLGARYPDQTEAVARLLAKVPSEQNSPYLVRGLVSTSPIVLLDCINGLLRAKYQPKADDASAYRSVILAVSRMNEVDRPQAVKLLQQWKSQHFAADARDWQAELQGWSRWYGQSFPKEEPLPNVTALTAKSKWKMDELQHYLEQDPRGKAGDPGRGKVVFGKANCIKCHKFGSDGEGIGPDLTTLKSRFKRADILEAILDPSRTISDQYRGTVIVTQGGQTVTGLAAPQGDSITVLQIDGTKVTIKKSDVDTQVASTISPMPEKLLDELTRQEIADLFAYLESVPK